MSQTYLRRCPRTAVCSSFVGVPSTYLLSERMLSGILSVPSIVPVDSVVRSYISYWPQSRSVADLCRSDTAGRRSALSDPFYHHWVLRWGMSGLIWTYPSRRPMIAQRDRSDRDTARLCWRTPPVPRSLQSHRSGRYRRGHPVPTDPRPSRRQRWPV